MKLLQAEAGVNDGKAGLLSAAGLFAKGGIFDKKSESFNIQELEPYLLFDARESMLGTLENPTLDLDPATPSTLDVITATRAGVATYTDADGNIQSAAADTVRVDHVQGEELTPTVYQRVGYTDFSQNWSLVRCTVEDGNGYSGQPSKIVTAAGDTIFYRINCPTSAGVVYTASVYVRLISGTGTFRINHQNSPTNSNTIIPITTEWQRVEADFIGLGGSTPVGVSGMLSGDVIEVSSLQVEEGTTATDFAENTTGSPKFIAPATYGPRVPMILVEPSATNLFRNSQDLTASPNTVANGTITQESETFKGQPVFRLTDDTSSSEHRLSIPAGSVTASRVNVHFFVKPDTCTKFCITYPTAGDAAAAWNLSSGSALGSLVGSAVSQTIEDAGDGWFKVSMTYDRPTATAVGHNIQILPDSATRSANRNYQGDGTLSFLMTMPQLEYGEVQTSFIPTSGSTVTRAADDLVIDGSDFTDFYNGSEGTFYVESKTKTNTAYIFQASGSVGNPYQNRHAAYNDSVNKLAVLSATGGGTQYSKTSLAAVSINELSRLAYSYKQSDFRVSFNGEAEPTPTGNQVPSLTIDQIHIGETHDGNYNLNGHIKRLIYWPYHSDSL